MAGPAIAEKLQSTALMAVFHLLRLLPLPVASGFGGWLGRTIGPRLKRSARAVNNLRMVFPEKNEAEIAAIVREMWDNVVRVVGEYPHVPEYAHGSAQRRIHVTGHDIVQRVRDSGRPSIFFSGHLANWEISPLVAMQKGMHVHLIYRPPNNPTARALLGRIRESTGGTLLPKGPQGARGIIRAMKTNGVVGLMVDQKFNEGIAAPFLGRDAMTSPALAEMCFKYNAHAVPVRVERINGCDFRVTVHEPLEFERTGDRVADVQTATAKVNALIGDWVRARPGQWLWLHRRWPESA